MSERGHLGERIHRRRVALGLSLARLSEAVGCAKSYLSQIENGVRSGVSEALLGAIEEALMLPAGELVELSRLERTPASVRERLEAAEARGRQVRELLRLLGEGGGCHESRLDATMACRAHSSRRKAGRHPIPSRSRLPEGSAQDGR